MIHKLQAEVVPFVQIQRVEHLVVDFLTERLLLQIATDVTQQLQCMLLQCQFIIRTEMRSAINIISDAPYSQRARGVFVRTDA